MKILNSCRGAKNLDYLSSLALSILNLLDVSFAYQDLQGIKAPSAILSGGMFY